ncbi:heme-degrading domain-containing protein [Anaerolentibacter hominis]|uniref:heme-degrading domain-containing protein n=1 Tax=Anaerolentibacter hominis TaxID=3079009 RepID=UPI0031B86084
MDYNEEIVRIAEQEKKLQFTKFDSFDALELGTLIIERAKKEQRTIAIHISLNRRDLFHFSFPGAAPDNDYWLRRKENAVYFFGKSSLALEYEMEQKNRDIKTFLGLSEPIAAKGGGFPIILRGTGPVGAVVVSGMQSFEDHAFAAEAIEAFLSK